MPSYSLFPCMNMMQRGVSFSNLLWLNYMFLNCNSIAIKVISGLYKYLTLVSMLLSFYSFKL